ncbi:MAG: hypothetical protein CL910_01275 [Deltaproteobacteria bacterium]|jgi:RND family efflux transporter MFP subunit|nr:hypothetical protein [Deltaproteobacteria bacterium]
MRTRSSLLIPLVIGLAGTLACNEAVQDKVEIARPVVVQAVEIATLAERIEATGELRAKDQATIASEIPGRITELLVEEGQRVEEGELLLTIDPEKRKLELLDSRARLAEVHAALKESERDLERARKLHDQKIASQQALDKADTALVSARSRLAAAEARVGVAARALQDAQVRAPFAGLIAERSVSRGEYVQVGMPLLDVVVLDPVEVEFSVSERDSARVAVGLEVAVRVSPYPGETFTGLVSVISPTIDSKTRTLRVKARLENADGRLRPGLFAEADLGISRREGVIIVPEEAVLLRAKGELVYVATAENRAQRRFVETGTRRNRKVEIVSGLNPGEEVIVRGHAALADGTLISRRRFDGSPESSELNVAGESADLAAGENAKESALQ